MNASTPAPAVVNSGDSALMTRREALKRTALFLGLALSPSLFEGTLQAATAPGATSAFLSASQSETAASIAERILPRTDTPGARDVGVPAYINLMVGKYYSAEEQRLFTAGLVEIDGMSTSAHQKPFAALSGEQQDAVLMQLAKQSKGKDKSFLVQMRELTLLGYFTSEKVGREVTHYDPVPGRYNGCVPISEVGNRLWTK